LFAREPLKSSDGLFFCGDGGAIRLVVKVVPCPAFERQNQRRFAVRAERYSNLSTAQSDSARLAFVMCTMARFDHAKLNLAALVFQWSLWQVFIVDNTTGKRVGASIDATEMRQLVEMHARGEAHNCKCHAAKHRRLFASQPAASRRPRERSRTGLL